VDWLREREANSAMKVGGVFALVAFAGLAAFAYFVPTSREEPALRAVVASVPMPREPSSCKGYSKAAAGVRCIYQVAPPFAANAPEMLDALAKQGWRVTESDARRAALCKSNTSLRIESLDPPEKGEVTVTASLIPFLPTKVVWRELAPAERKCLELIGVSPR